MTDYIIRAIDEDKGIRIFVASTTNMVEEARKVHNASVTATAALGRVLTATSIMGFMMKGNKDKITLSIKGNGPIGTILAVSNHLGVVKGYADHPEIELPAREDGKINVGGAVGHIGRLTVIRDLGLKEPYIGQSNLVTGEIGEDLAQYFLVSEQQPSAVALGVLVNRDLTVKAAGGFIVQVLPNIEEASLSKLEEVIGNMASISSLIDRGYTPEDILDKEFKDFNMEVIDKLEVSLSCDCSKERLEQVLVTIGEDELTSMIAEDGEAEVVCHFCNTKYHFDKNELNDILQEAKQKE